MRPGRSARALLTEARTLQTAARDALTAPETRRKGARRAFDAVRGDVVKAQMATIPISRLRETTEGRLRLGPIEAAGYRTVAAAAAAGRHRLEQLPGVGPQTAAQVIAAARQLEAAIEESVRIRFDPDSRPPLQTELLAALHAYEVAEQAVSPLRPQLEELTPSLDRVVNEANLASSRLKLLFSRRQRRDAALDALMELTTLLGSPAVAAARPALTAALATVEHPVPDAASQWQDYEARAVTYNGLLIEVGELSPDLDAVQGFVPSEIAERVHAQPLDTSLLGVSLRGYQAFGAKFALVQRQAIVGDEMGLGKTIEALAAMCHLHVEGETHFLVVCPASVLVNWTHEVQGHSKLRPYRLHGSQRERQLNLAVWARRGGVAVTTFDSLRSLTKPEDVRISMLVVDEAHYVKNPTTLRTKTVAQWSGEADRTLFLTGTPMENRVEEFKTLVGHLQPEVAARVSSVDGLAGAEGFRKAVAPVYLRRNQADVLEELPPRIESEEWVEFLGDDLDNYRQAVASGNFMAMRRAAYVSSSPAGSAKLARLVEIVEESVANERKVVVFSYFRDVLTSVGSLLGDLVVGPVTGSVSPGLRQEMVDHFTSRIGPAVLVSQIEAGGVGLNMQAASVVILTEPQWKPTTEDQAIARCHRMGQIRPVNVHRLLAEDSVDKRMLEILATKAVLFDEYVRRSELKEISADAVDVSDIDVTRDVVTQAEAERRIVEIERKRLGLEPQLA
ncbi:MAG: DEAD/DEAH box helicase [Actinomycetota bacterium]|nr:DEAD/DEAH box helicase [Actinomycetota bacterium]